LTKEKTGEPHLTEHIYVRSLYPGTVVRKSTAFQSYPRWQNAGSQQGGLLSASHSAGAEEEEFMVQKKLKIRQNKIKRASV